MIHTATNVRFDDRAMFTAHGEYSIFTFGRLVCVDAWGPWNVERTIDYVRQLKRHLEEMPKPFGLLMVSHEQPILGPDGEAVLREHVRDRVRLGCAAQATVLLESSTASIAEAQYRRIYVPEGLRYEIFYKVAPAVKWLVDSGFTDVNWDVRTNIESRPFSPNRSSGFL